jgi:NIMA (never in mitosis gene a)-related kinase
MPVTAIYQQEGYKRGEVVGKGAFGEAAIIYRLSDGHRFISKEVNLDALDERDREGALREAMLLSQMDHTNIVKYVDSFQHKPVLFIVMEFADGGDLGTLIKKQRTLGYQVSPQYLSEDLIMNYFVQLCLALKYLHDRKVLHRDLKAGNVFLTKDGFVKLGDFGLSTILTNTVAYAKTMCGTPYYFSPELCKNKPYNNKSDVWSLGCIFYEMCTLQHAFDGRNIKMLMKHILKGTYPPIPPQYSKNMNIITDSLLQQDCVRRPGINRILGNDFVRNHLHRYHQKLESQSAAAKNAQEAHSAGDLEKLKEKRQQRHRDKLKQMNERKSAVVDQKSAAEQKAAEQEKQAKQQQEAKQLMNQGRGALKDFLKGPPPEELLQMQQQQDKPKPSSPERSAPAPSTEPEDGVQKASEEVEEDAVLQAMETEQQCQSVMGHIDKVLNQEADTVEDEVFGDEAAEGEDCCEVPEEEGLAATSIRANELRAELEGNLGAEAIKKACAILKEEGSDEDVLMQRVKEVLGPKADTEQCAQLAQLAMYEAVTQNK